MTFFLPEWSLDKLSVLLVYVHNYCYVCNACCYFFTYSEGYLFISTRNYDLSIQLNFMIQNVILWDKLVSLMFCFPSLLGREPA